MIFYSGTCSEAGLLIFFSVYFLLQDSGTIGVPGLMTGGVSD